MRYDCWHKIRLLILITEFGASHPRQAGSKPPRIRSVVSRKERSTGFTAHLAYQGADADKRDNTRSAHREPHREALDAVRQAVLAMHANDEIDEAFHRLEEQLDRLEIALNSRPGLNAMERTNGAGADANRYSVRA